MGRVGDTIICDHCGEQAELLNVATNTGFSWYRPGRMPSPWRHGERSAGIFCSAVCEKKGPAAAVDQMVVR